MVSINVNYVAAVPLSHFMLFIVWPVSDKINEKAQYGLMNVPVNAVNGRKPWMGLMLRHRDLPRSSLKNLKRML